MFGLEFHDSEHYRVLKAMPAQVAIDHSRN